MNQVSMVHLASKCFMLCCISLAAVACTKNTTTSPPPATALSDGEALDYLLTGALGGGATSTDPMATSHAYAYPIPSLSPDDLETHLSGDTNFELAFTTDLGLPSSGLGPVYNNSSCVGCHNGDGRGSLPTGLNETTWTRLGPTEAIFLRISIENDDILSAPKTVENNFGAPVAVPGYSTQLFHLGTMGVRDDSPGSGQAEVWLKTQKSAFRYPDGSVVELSKPIFKVERPFDAVTDPRTGQVRSRLFEADVKTSPRIGMPMIGLGLLEAIPEADILALARSPHDEGVRGTANYVYDALKAQSGDPNPVSLGRFGLKANAPTVRQQALAAFNGDMGVTNSLFQNESILGTDFFTMLLQKLGLEPRVEAADEFAEAIVFYSRTLAVPPRRNISDPSVIEGGRMFSTIRCTSCHTPSFTTGEHQIAALSGQKIFPFTDLLLHDMGEGLADGRQDFLADGRQWKTRPLWGLGLTQVVNPRAGFLHDGRASTIEAAILWHDGEARYSRDQFAALTREKRLKVLAFLRSL